MKITNTPDFYKIHFVLDDIKKLNECKSLSVLDLSYNRLEDPLVLDVLAELPKLTGISNIL